MDGARKDLSSKPSPVPKPSFSVGTGDNDENELSSNQQVSGKMHSRQKAVKHFMSPTISASSKAVSPRKKILVERNEASAFPDGPVPKLPNVDPRTGPFNPRNSCSGRSLPRGSSSYNCTSESDDDENNAFVANSHMRPYDPLTNYLSPRPKYLRYKPNRRLQIFSRLEDKMMEGNDDVDEEILSLDAHGSSPSPLECHRNNDDEETDGVGSFDSQEDIDQVLSLDAQGSSPPPLECQGDPANEEIEEQDGTDSEVEDGEDEQVDVFKKEGRRNFTRIMEFLLVMLSLFLSTSYILSMNSPTPSYTQLAIWNLKDGYDRIQEHLLKDVAINIFGDENGYQGLIEVFELDGFSGDQVLENDKFKFDDDVAVDNLEVIESVDEQVEAIEPMEVLDQLALAELTKSEIVFTGETEVKQQEDSDTIPASSTAEEIREIGEVSDQLELTKSEIVFAVETEIKQLEDSDTIPASSAAEENEEDTGDHELGKSTVDSDLQVEESRKNLVNDAENHFSNNDHDDFLTEAAPSVTESQINLVQEIFMEMNKVQRLEDLSGRTDDTTASVVKSGEQAAQEIFVEIENNDQEVEDLSGSSNEKSVAGYLENTITESDASNSEIGLEPMESNVETGSVYAAGIMLSCFMILAPLALIYSSRNTRAVQRHAATLPRVKQMEKSLATEAVTVPCVEEVCNEKKSEFLKKPSSLFDQTKRIAEETSCAPLAPQVVLLGELEFGLHGKGSSFRSRL